MMFLVYPSVISIFQPHLMLTLSSLFVRNNNCESFFIELKIVFRCETPFFWKQVQALTTT